MNILIGIAHPAHVHFFRNAIAIWREHGHRVFVVTRHIPVAEQLLAHYGLEFQVISRKRTGTVGLALELGEHTAKLFPRLLKWKIDVCAAIGGTFVVYAGLLAGCRRIVCTDTDTATIANRITFPLANAILTPAVYPHDLGGKHVRYRGFHELAYLHPNYFAPDPTILAKYALTHETIFSVARFSSWEAAHDIGLIPATNDEKIALIKRLRQAGKVLIVPERHAPPELLEYCVKMNPADFHHLLYYAFCCVTEGATTASEACLLGTPALYFNPASLCYIDALQRYGLLKRGMPGQNLLPELEATLRLAADKTACRRLAGAIIQDCCDVTRFLADFVEQPCRKNRG